MAPVVLVAHGIIRDTVLMVSARRACDAKDRRDRVDRHRLMRVVTTTTIGLRGKGMNSGAADPFHGNIAATDTGSMTGVSAG